MYISNLIFSTLHHDDKDLESYIDIFIFHLHASSSFVLPLAKDHPAENRPQPLRQRFP